MYKHLGINFFTEGKEKFLEELKNSLKKGEQNFSITPNPEIMVLASNNENFREILKESKWNIPDGFGLVIGSFIEKNLQKNFSKCGKIFPKFIKFFFYLEKFFWLKIFGKKGISPLENRICGSDIFYDICNLSENLETELGNFGIYLIGGDIGVPQKVKHKLNILYPKLKIFGTFDGNFGDEKQISELEKDLLKTNPKIIFVAMGAPKQEILIKKFQQLNPKILFGIGIGGTFDFVIGKQKRAPKIMQKLGLEWIYRLYKEPKRIGRIKDATFGYLSMLYKNI